MLIPLGAAAGWRWIRHRRLRLFHAGAIAFVALESLAGIACPLTVWEAMLRGGTSGETGFIGHWLHRLLYWDFSAAAFTLLYVALALLAVLALAAGAASGAVTRQRPGDMLAHELGSVVAA